MLLKLLAHKHLDRAVQEIFFQIFNCAVIAHLSKAAVKGKLGYVLHAVFLSYLVNVTFT